MYVTDLYSKLDSIKSKEQPADNLDSRNLPFELSVTKKKRKKQTHYKASHKFKRALVDPQPLYISDGLLINTLKDIVGEIHGDFGRASVATGKIMLNSGWLTQKGEWLQ